MGTGSSRNSNIAPSQRKKHSESDTHSGISNTFRAGQLAVSSAPQVKATQSVKDFWKGYSNETNAVKLYDGFYQELFSSPAGPFYRQLLPDNLKRRSALWGGVYGLTKAVMECDNPLAWRDIKAKVQTLAIKHCKWRLYDNDFRRFIVAFANAIERSHPTYPREEFINIFDPILFIMSEASRPVIPPQELDALANFWWGKFLTGSKLQAAIFESFYEALFETENGEFYDMLLPEFNTKRQDLFNGVIVLTTSVIEQTINNVDQGALTEQISRLAVSHKNFRLSSEDFKTFGRIFYAELKKHAGSELSKEAGRALKTLWESIITMMCDANRDVSANGGNARRKTRLSSLAQTGGSKRNSSVQPIARHSSVKPFDLQNISRHPSVKQTDVPIVARHPSARQIDLDTLSDHPAALGCPFLASNSPRCPMKQLSEETIGGEEEEFHAEI